MHCPKEFIEMLPKVKEMIDMGFGRNRISKTLNIKTHRARTLIDLVNSGIYEEKQNSEIIDKIIQQQKYDDSSRVKRKYTREKSRFAGVLEELTKEMIDLLEKKSLSHFSIRHDKQNNKSVGVIHLSDIHFNELIDIRSNKYDFNIASMRLFLLAERAKIYFSSMGVTDVLLALTGDLMNSDRRLDEMLNASSNRTKATFLAVDIIQQFIIDINKTFNVTVAYVSGNESRVNQELGWAQNIVSDSYDTMIFYILKKIFKNSKGISFIEGNCSELVVNIGNVNFLLLHGHGCISTSVEKSISQIKGRYSSEGINLDYIIFGHIHSALIGDTFARSSSLCGSNSYSEKSLNLYGRASQNLYIIHDNKLIDGLKIDLQITEGNQYLVDNTLAEYNSKSDNKNKSQTTIFQVVV